MWILKVLNPPTYIKLLIHILVSCIVLAIAVLAVTVGVIEGFYMKMTRENYKNADV